MSMMSTVAAARPVVPGVGDLTRMAASRNPFVPRAAVLERTIVSDRIGLLVGDGSDGMTLLYVWTHEDPGGLAWLSHLARWTAGYPAWRSAHGLPPCARPLQVIVAVPGSANGVRDAIRLLVGSVAVVAYQCIEIDGELVLGWETGTVTRREDTSDRVSERATEQATNSARSTDPDTLTPEEWAYFQPLKNR